MGTNGKLLTLFVLPSRGNGEFDNYERIVESSPHKLCKFVMVSPDRKTLSTPETEWWGIIYGNEWFDFHLTRALPSYLQIAPFEGLVLFKRVKVNGVERFYIEPRIFRSERVVPTLKPDIGKLFCTRVLDGFLLEDDRTVEVSYD